MQETEIHEYGRGIPIDPGKPHGCAAGFLTAGDDVSCRCYTWKNFLLRKTRNTQGENKMTERGLRDSDCLIMEVQNPAREKRYAPVEEENGDGTRKGSGFMQIYPVIDMLETGRQLKQECDRRQISPKELQDFLGLAALQSVYGWFQGRTLPSLDNFYALSRYLGMQMEELVVPQKYGREVLVREARRTMERRLMAYFGFCLQAEADAA